MGIDIGPMIDAVGAIRRAEHTGRCATYVIAASDATAQEKAQADVVLTGTNDEVQINALVASGITIGFFGTVNIGNNIVLITLTNFRLMGLDSKATIKARNQVRTTLAANVDHGATSITVSDSTGFLIGQRIGIRDTGSGANSENVVISNIVGNVLTISAIVKAGTPAYLSGADVADSWNSVEVYNSTGIELDHFTVDQNYTNWAYPVGGCGYNFGIELNYSKGSVHDITVKNIRDNGISIINNYTLACDAPIVYNCVFDTGATASKYFTSGTVSGLHCQTGIMISHHNKFRSLLTGVCAESCGDIAVRDSQFTTMGTNSLFTNTSCGALEFIGNRCDSGCVQYIGSGPVKMCLNDMTFDSTNGLTVSGLVATPIVSGFIQNNIIIQKTNTGVHCIVLFEYAQNIVISGNKIYGASHTEDWVHQGGGIWAYSATVGNLTITDNIIDNVYYFFLLPYLTGEKTIIRNNRLGQSVYFCNYWAYTTAYIQGNVGFNPVGLIATPIGTAKIGASGSGTAVTASTDYVVTITDCFITSTNSSNANNAILIKDNLGNTIIGPVSTLTAQFVPVDYKINWGAFTGTAGTVTVWGN